MKKRLINQIPTRWGQLALLASLLLVPLGTWAGEDTGGTDYGLSVAGVAVTSENASNVLGDDQATVSYDNATSTLTLSNATIDMSNGDATAPILSSVVNLTVNLIGSTTVTVNPDNPCFAVYSGQGGEDKPSLTFITDWAEDGNGEYSLGHLTINGTSTIAEGFFVSNNFEELSSAYIDPDGAEDATTGWKRAENATNGSISIWYLEVYDLWVGSGRVISSALEAGQSGGPKFNPVTQRLVFTESCSYPVKSSLEELVIEVAGEYCGINGDESPAISFQPTKSQETGKLKFVTGGDSQGQHSFYAESESGVITGFSEVTIESPLMLTEPATAPSEWNINTPSFEIKDFIYHPQIFSDTSDGKITMGFEYEESATLHYSIDYVDENLDDVADATWTYGDSIVILLGPCTVQAYTVRETLTSTTVMAKLFGYVETSREETWDGYNTYVPAPSLVPSIGNDVTSNLTLEPSNSIFTKQQDDTFLITGFGSTTVSGTLTIYPTDEQPYTVLNAFAEGEGDGDHYDVGSFTLTTVPVAPTFGLDEGIYDEPQELTLSTDYDSSLDFDIMYAYGASAKDGTIYTEPIEINEGTVTLTAWVEAHDPTGAVFSSEPVTATYIVKTNPGLVFYDPTIATHLSEVNEATVTIGQEFAAPALSNPNQLEVTFSSSNPDVATIDQQGNVTIVSYGETTITAAFDGNEVYGAGSASYTLIVSPMSYGIWINGTEITQANMNDVITQGWVSYNGKGTLILNNCTRPIVIDCGDYSTLTIYLKGANQTGSIIGKGKLLTITTDPVAPGTLELGTAEGESAAINGFEKMLLEAGLSWLSGDMYSASAAIGTVIKPLVTETVVTPKAEDLDPENIDEENKVSADDPADQTIIINKVVDEVLYTLVVQNEEGENVEIFEEEDGKAAIVLNTAIDATDVESAMDEEPGTASFAKTFEGITLRVAAGSGNVVLDVEVPANATLAVKVGNAEPVLFSDIAGEIPVPYVLDEAAYVYIYNATPAASPSRSLREKVKSTPVRMFSVGVKPAVVSEAPDPEKEALAEKSLTNEAVNAVAISNGQFALADPTITTLNDDIFSGLDLKSIDLTSTSITGLIVNRSSGAFSGVSPQTFIYLPSGNIAGVGEPNVIIGGVCNNMLLTNDDQQFAPAITFGAKAATLNRDFIEGQTSTVYLPFDLDKSAADALGTFYTFKGITAAGEADLEPVTSSLAANTPYIFQKKAGGQITVNSVTVKATTPSATQLIGTYDPITFTSSMIDEAAATGDHYYGFAAANEGDNIKAGEFVQVGPGATIKPYRAYLKVHYDAARIAVKFDDGQATGITTVAGTAGDAWYTIGGTRLQSAPTQPGLYIHNGKKTINK